MHSILKYNAVAYTKNAQYTKIYFSILKYILVYRDEWLKKLYEDSRSRNKKGSAFQLGRMVQNKFRGRKVGSEWCDNKIKSMCDNLLLITDC